MAHLTSWYWDKGRCRENNEDSFSLQRVRVKKQEVSFMIVCDGIGGLPEGETASGYVTERMTEWFYQKGIGKTAGFFWRRRTADSASEALFMTQKKMECCEREEGICCGTTCTMAVVKGGQFVLLHTGDSRAYRIGRKEVQLTCDHHKGGALCRCMGAFGYQPPDVTAGALKKGEQLLICTDGFSRLVPRGFFKGCLLTKEQKPEVFYKRLKGTGGFLCAQGEKDNMTALLLTNLGRRGLHEEGAKRRNGFYRRKI